MNLEHASTPLPNPPRKGEGTGGIEVQQVTLHGEFWVNGVGRHSRPRARRSGAEVRSQSHAHEDEGMPHNAAWSGESRGTGH